jgi:hypothetical protein
MLLALSLVLLAVISIWSSNKDAVNLVGDIAKILAGALGGALAGEKE